MRNSARRYLSVSLLSMILSMSYFLLPSQVYAGVGEWTGGGYLSNSGTNIIGFAASADGTKLFAINGNAWSTNFLDISTDGGATWHEIPDTVGKGWISITASADGTKLAAGTVNSIYISHDSGTTWSKVAGTGSKSWEVITSSADGTKLLAQATNDGIWVSKNSGSTFTRLSGQGGFDRITSSTDNAKLFSIHGYYTPNGLMVSSDSGISWSSTGAYVTHLPGYVFDPAKQFYYSAVASSDDGTKLFATVMNGPILRSIDGGTEWQEVADTFGQKWMSITSSIDGTRLFAGATGGVWTSSDSGVTWSKIVGSEGKGRHMASSPDGNRVTSLANKTWSYSLTDPVLAIDILTPFVDEQVSTWSPYVSWGTATNCGYNWDGSETYIPVNCANNGSDIPLPPSYGPNTLTVQGRDINETVVTKSRSFTRGLPIVINSPTAGIVKIWEPSIEWNIDNLDISTLTCSYSYNNFGIHEAGASETMTDCASDGSDIPVPETDGNNTLSLKVTNQTGDTGISSVNFNSGWTEISGTNMGQWRSITSSADGTKLAALAGGTADIRPANWDDGTGSIWTSSDSGTSWQEASGTSGKLWRSIASSADGTKLVAVDGNADQMAASETNDGSIWISIDSGTTWTVQPDTSGYNWRSIASSADGKNLAAVYGTTDNGAMPSSLTYGASIWISHDSGATWTPIADTTDRHWRSIASSADGTKLVAGTDGGSLWSSIDSGATWNEGPNTLGHWESVTSSADGSRFFAGSSMLRSDGVIEPAGIGSGLLTSTDFGATWTQVINDARGYGGSYSVTYSSVTSSADGTKLIAGTRGDSIWTSLDSGTTWQEASNTGGGYGWTSITSSADGTKLFAVDERNGGSLWVYSSLTPELKVDILIPSEDTIISAWTPFVSMGSASICEYSWDNERWTTTDCTNNGSDISLPTTGENTLHVKGIDRKSIEVMNQVSFTSVIAVPAAPTLTAPTAADIITTGATLGASISSLGVPDVITARGICIGTTPDPSLTSGATCTPLAGEVALGVFTQSITGLTAGTLYHYRAYATNETGTAYTIDSTFTTLSEVVNGGGGSGGGSSGGGNWTPVTTTKIPTPTTQTASQKIFTTFLTKTLDENKRIGFATRLETVLLALKVKGIPMLRDYACQKLHTDTFGDLVPSYTCQVAEKAQAVKMISETNKEFNPLKPVSRIEAYAIMMKSICVQPDTAITPWQSSVIQKAIDLGFTVRTLDTFDPSKELSVPEMYTLAQRLSDYGKTHETCKV